MTEDEKNEELIEIGIEASETKDYQKALEAFLKITPSFEQYDIVKGEIIGFYYNLKNYEEVIRLAKLETEENESYPIIVANWMRAHLHLEQYQDILNFHKTSKFIFNDEEAKRHYLITVQNAAMKSNDNNLASDIAKLLDNMYIKLNEDFTTTYIAF